MFLLDTDHLVILQNQPEPEFVRLSDRTHGFPPGDFFVSIVSFHKQLNGWNAYLNRARTTEGVVRGYRELQWLIEDYSTHSMLPFDTRAAEIFDSLRKQKVRVGTMDLRIASIALARDFTVLTRNIVDFQKVPGLKVEDWTAG